MCSLSLSSKESSSITSGDKAARDFQRFLWTVVIGSLVVGLSILVLYERFILKRSSPDDPSKQHDGILREYHMTCTIAAGYVRMFLHDYTKKKLQKHSQTFASFQQVDRASDTAWMIMDASTILFWIPILLYCIFKCYTFANMPLAWATISNLASIMFEIYLADRVTQLCAAGFDRHRIVHHVAVATILIGAVEWFPSIRDPAPVILFLYEGIPRPMHFWFASCRLMRQHAKQVTALQQTAANSKKPRRLDDVPIHGLDRLFVWADPDQAATMTRFFLGLFSFSYLFPPLLFLWAITVGPFMLPIWQYLAPVVYGFYFFVDWEIFLFLWKRSKRSYWQEEIFAPPAPNSVAGGVAGKTSSSKQE